MVLIVKLLELGLGLRLDDVKKRKKIRMRKVAEKSVKSVLGETKLLALSLFQAFAIDIFLKKIMKFPFFFFFQGKCEIFRENFEC